MIGKAASLCLTLFSLLQILCSSQHLSGLVKVGPLRDRYSWISEGGCNFYWGQLSRATVFLQRVGSCQRSIRKFVGLFNLRIEILLYSFKKVAHVKEHEICEVLGIAKKCPISFQPGDILVQSSQSQLFGAPENFLDTFLGPKNLDFFFDFWTNF